MSTLEVNKITPQGTATEITLGDSGDTFTIPSGVTLTNNGTASGFGKIGQVVQGTDTTETAITSTSYADTGLSASITPTSTSSKILVMWDIQYRVNTGSSNNIIAFIKTLRDTTLIGSYAKARSDGFVGEYGGTITFSFLDTPSSTSSITYKTQAALGTSGDGRTFYAETGQGGVTALSAITLMEVLA